ncbi:MAG: PAAR-like domain-containing protein, partial [Lysobacterales bacterium]
MPSSITVNLMTTQHKVSVGITSAFPDVCKTPAPPAPTPVPIPYPNVGLSGMASIKVTKRVGDDTGQKVMLMGSSYSLTSGDEPGVALGIISNRVKGKSTTKNSSFNVKFEGKGV